MSVVVYTHTNTYARTHTHTKKTLEIDFADESLEPVSPREGVGV